MSDALATALDAAAAAIRSADALLIGAGAGMGVDSGLPDFRGPEGFWRAYPPFRGRRFGQFQKAGITATVRINPRDVQGGIAIPLGAFDALQQLARRL